MMRASEDAKPESVPPREFPVVDDEPGDIRAIIPISTGAIGTEQGIPTVDGRKVWEWLRLGRDFSNWVKDQIESLELVENMDYVVFAQKGENLQGGRPSGEYHFTLDAAKHIRHYRV